jgi:hypothetical protein
MGASFRRLIKKYFLIFFFNATIFLIFEVVVINRFVDKKISDDMADSGFSEGTIFDFATSSLSKSEVFLTNILHFVSSILKS